MGLHKLLGRFWKKSAAMEDDAEMPYSIVLLLRRPHFFTQQELEAAGERAWRKRFDGVEDQMYFVVRMGGITMMKAGKYVVQVAHMSQPYMEDIEEGAKQLPQDEQKKAWRGHSAWVALDFRNKRTPKEEAYAVLARFARQLGDENCCALYFPKECWMMPNDGTAEQGLGLLMDGFQLS